MASCQIVRVDEPECRDEDQYGVGYVPVTFAELTDDEAYWKGCGTPEHPCCVNYDILQRTGRRYCVCTAMLYDPAAHPDEKLPVELPEDVVKMAREAAAKNLR